MTWLDSLSLTGGPLNHRLRYRALCDMRARMASVSIEVASIEPGSDLAQAAYRAARQLESMHRNADAYLRLR